eukprot:526648-Pyramimonas_sp.AAC.1
MDLWCAASGAPVEARRNRASQRCCAASTTCDAPLLETCPSPAGNRVIPPIGFERSEWHFESAA